MTDIMEKTPFVVALGLWRLQVMDDLLAADPTYYADLDADRLPQAVEF